MTDSHHRLSEFITKRMRMSHIYQPLMLKVLLEAGGTASKETIAKAFLLPDPGQVEYYGGDRRQDARTGPAEPWNCRARG